MRKTSVGVDVRACERWITKKEKMGGGQESPPKVKEDRMRINLITVGTKTRK